MLIRYGQAALLAVLATLMGTTVWAQGSISGLTPAGCKTKDCCATGACCKDGKCCKDGASCCKGKKCDASCACCKDSKCECSKGGDCCCKEGKCSCKDKSGCCCNAKKCGASCTCCKDNKCECGKSGDCCCKGKTSVVKMGCGCPFLNKLAKSTAIIMVMPSSLPLQGTCPPAAMGMMPHPPMPMGPHAMMPMPLPPPPPMLTPPGLPVPTMVSPSMPPQTVAMPVPPSPGYCPCPTATPILPCPPTPDAVTVSRANPCVDTCLQVLDLACELSSLMHPKGPSLCASALEFAMMGMCPTMDRCGGAYCGGCTPPVPTIAPPPTLQVNRDNTGNLIFGYSVNSNCGQTCSIVPSGPPVVVRCTETTNPSKVRIIAVPSNTDLEMNVGDETCVRCKKMTVKIGNNEIIVSRFEDRVRVRGDELKATADSVRSDRKDRIILEGDVVLHYKKDGHCANVTGDRIELNLSSGAVTIKPAEKAAVSRPSVRIQRIETDESSSK